MSKLAQRIIIAIVMLSVVAGLLFLNGWPLFIGMVILAMMAEYEMSGAVGSDGDPVCRPILFAFTLLLPAAFYFFGFAGAFVTCALLVCALFTASLFIKKYTMDSVIKGCFSFFYPQALFMFFYATIIRSGGMEFVSPETNRFVMIATAAISILTDTMAYFIGSAIGRHKLCPSISPHKSIEGAIAGLAGGALGAALVMVIFRHSGIVIWAYMLFSVLLSALSQLGDLSASLVKRRFGIKDYSRILGVHGGIMDRLDSILFIMPYSYIFFFMIMGV